MLSARHAGKVLFSFIHVLLMAFIQSAGRIESTRELPWGIAVYFVALGMPFVAHEGVRRLLHSCISHSRVWAFCKALSLLVVVSYARWFDDFAVDFAYDNYQAERVNLTLELAPRTHLHPPPLPPPHHPTPRHLGSRPASPHPTRATRSDPL